MPVNFKRLKMVHTGTNALPSEEDAKLLLQRFTAVREEMQLLDVELGELRKQVARYNSALAELERYSKGKRGHFKSRLSTILASTIRRLDSSCCSIDSSSGELGEEKGIRRSLIVTEKRIQVLSKHLVRLGDEAAWYKTALAPHKRLPEDVLRHIFTLSCAATPDNAITLSQVCSQWRCIVLDMPLLRQQRQEALNQRMIAHCLAKFVRRQERSSRLYARRKKCLSFLHICGVTLLRFLGVMLYIPLILLAISLRRLETIYWSWRSRKSK